MADTNFRGPVNSMGSLETTNASTSSTTVVQIDAMDGPSMLYQWQGWPDIRGAPFAKDAARPGQLPAFMAIGDIYAVDAIPQAQNTTLLAAAQVITSGVAMNLATVGVTNFSAGAASLAVGVPIVPQGTSTPVNVIALDFGFTTGTTIANSTAVQVNDTTVFTQGQWIIIGNVGNSSATASLVTQVQSTINATTIGVLPSPATAMGVAIGAANLFGSQFLPPPTQFGPSASVPNSHSPRTVAGLARVMNAREMLSRNIAISMATGGVFTAAFIVNGYDVWNQAMSELITVNASTGVTTAWGKKAFKYVLSVVAQTTFSTAQSMVGFGDVFGFPFRYDQTEHVQVTAGGTAVPNNVGFSTAVLSAATNSTGDVRGTIQLSGSGPGTPISSVATSNNVKRLVIIQNIPSFNMLNATPNNLGPMFGTTQV